MRELLEFPGYWVTEDCCVFSKRTLVDGSKTCRELTPHVLGHVTLRKRGRDCKRKVSTLHNDAYPELMDRIPKFTGEPDVDYRKHKNYPGYLFGDDGSVWSCRSPGKCKYRKNFIRLRPYVAKDGYVPTALSDVNDKSQMVLMHRIILEVFVGPCPEGKEACHNDGDRSNNVLSNLRWDTRVSNHADKILHGTGNKGSRHNLAKLTEDQVLEIRKKYDSERNGPRLGRIFTLQALADEYGVTRGMTYRIVNRLNWTHV